MSLDNIQDSINREHNSIASNRAFNGGRTGLMVASFLLISALVFRYLLIPELPPAEMPRIPPLELEKIYSPVKPEWTRPRVAEVPAASLEDVADVPQDLMSWRRRQADYVLGATAVDLVAIYNFQVRILETQRDDGTWPGADPLAATGLAALALQAYPSDPLIKEKLGKTHQWLLRMVRNPRPGSNKLATALAYLALIDAGQLSPLEYNSKIPILTDGSQAKWQTLVVAAIPPENRPKDGNISPIRTNLKEPFWKIVVAPFSEVDVFDGQGFDQAIFDASEISTLQGIDRVGWGLANWTRGGNKDSLNEALQTWSRQDPPAPADQELRSLAGPMADLAMAVLATTTPLRSPVPWFAEESK